MRLLRLAVLSVSLPAAFLLSGCNLSQFSAPSLATSALPAISGSVHGGQQPVAGATVQLYAANTTTTKGAATPLLTTTVKTNSSGAFTITGDYTCPAPTALVYIVATGGNPGLGGSVNNTAIAEMTVLGTCGSLTASTFISINELTTVAAVEALAPFMLDFANIGASTPASLVTAFGNAVAYVDTVTGTFKPTVPTGVTAPLALLNTLADILSACVNTSGGSVGDPTPCGKLFQYTTGSAGNVIASLLYIVNNPTTNITQIFGIIVPASPFLPTLTVAPTSWAVPTAYALGTTYEHILDQLLADSQGHIWLLQPYAGTVTQYDTNLNLLHTFNVGSITSGGTALHMALDSSDNLWVPFGATLLKIGPDGSYKSPTTGYPIDQSGLASYNNFSFAIDSSGNVWGTVIRLSDSAICAIEYSSTGVLVSPASGYCSSVTLGTNSVAPTQMVADSSGNVYIFTFGTGTSPILKFNSAGAVTPIPTNTYYGASGYYTAIYDPKFQRIWASDTAILDNLKLDGTVASSTFNTPYVYGVVAPFLNGFAVDGGGDLWIATELGTLAEVGPSGAILSGCTTAYVCGVPIVASNIGSLAGVAVDPAGDVFTVNATDGVLLKYAGIAAPK